MVPPGGAIPAKTFIVPRRNNGPLLSADLAAGTALSVQYTGFSPTRETRRVPAARPRAQRRRLPHRAAVLRRRLAELHLRRPQGQHRLLHQRRGAGAGGPAGRHGEGQPAVPAARRHRRQRVAAGPQPAAEPGAAVRDPAVQRDAAGGQPAGRVHRLGEQRPDRQHVRQQPAQPGPARRWHLLPQPRPQRVPGRPDHRPGAGRPSPRAASPRPTWSTSRPTRPASTGSSSRRISPARSTGPGAAPPRSWPRSPRTRGSSRRSAGSSRWNHSYPTGIPEGYDASDRDGRLGHAVAGRDRRQRGRHDLRAVAGPVHRQRHRRARPGRSRGTLPLPDDLDSVKALKQLIVDFDTRKGVGRSGIDFFAVPGIADAADRRDFLVLRSLGDALDLAASDALRAGVRQARPTRTTYRWGKLHRFVFASPLGAPYSVPSAGNPFTSPLPGLPGIPVDGGFSVPDVCHVHAARGRAGRVHGRSRCRSAGSWPRRPAMRMAVGELADRWRQRGTRRPVRAEPVADAGSPTTRTRSGCTRST